MNFGEIQREVKEILQDASPTIVADIPDFINEAYVGLSEEVEIPSLKTLTSVVTSISLAYVNMPAGFSGKLLFVGDISARIDIAEGGLEELLEENPLLDTSGSVTKVALEGNILYYQGIPATTTTLIILSYSTPTLLSDTFDSPLHLPAHIHRPLLVYKAAALGYNIIEDGIEGEKLMTLKYENLYQTQGLAKFREYLVKRKSNISRSIWSY